MFRSLTFLIFALLTLGCGGPEGTEVESSAAISPDGSTTDLSQAFFVVDPTVSMVTWEGTKLLGGGHTGTVPIIFGQIATDAQGTLIGGRFTMDLREIKNLDITDEETNAKLVGHLKSADFFEVEKYPRAEFTLVQVQPVTDADAGHNYEVSGNLTLRDQTRGITLPANVELEGKQIRVTTPQFVIDRTDWGLEYRSEGVAGLVQDKIINDNIGLQISLVANQ